MWWDVTGKKVVGSKALIAICDLQKYIMLHTICVSGNSILTVSLCLEIFMTPITSVLKGLWQK